MYKTDPTWHKPETNIKARLKDFIFILYDYTSDLIHTAKDDEENAEPIMRFFYGLVCVLYDRPEFFNAFDIGACPVGPYYPIPETHYKKLKLVNDPMQKVYVKENNGALGFALIKPMRRIARNERPAMNLLWQKNAGTPFNLPDPAITVGSDSYQHQVYEFPQLPMNLSKATDENWTEKQCGEVVLGVLYAIRSAHRADPRLALRGLTPESFFICEINGVIKPFLIDLNTAVTENSSDEAFAALDHWIGDSKTIPSYVAPEARREDTEKDLLYKADIYSAGKIIQFIYLGCCGTPKDSRFLTRLQKLTEPLVKEDPKIRPEIDRVIMVYKDHITKERVSMLSLMGARNQQQDAFYCNCMPALQADDIAKTAETEPPLIFGVFDGIAGGARGREIALLAAQKTADFFQHTAFESPKTLETLTGLLCGECEQYCKENRLNRSGAAFALAVICNGHVSTVNLGDSRIYLCHGDTISPMTVDDRVSKKNDALFQYLGMDQSMFSPEPHFKDITLTQYDVVIAATDGLTDYVTPEELLEVTKTHTAPEDMIAALRRIVENRNGTDNLTVFVYRKMRKNEEESANG